MRRKNTQKQTDDFSVIRESSVIDDDFSVTRESSVIEDDLSVIS